MTKLLKKTIQKIKYRVRNRLVLSFLFEKLAAIGLRIRPYYLTQEFFLGESDLNLKPKLAPLVADFLSPSEIKRVYAHPESKLSMRDHERFIEEGYQCFALKHNDEVMTYMWCSLHRCHELYPFPLEEDEAYLSGAFTFRAYRGENLAPFLRYQLYQQLKKIGRDKFYSLTDVFNTPAIKFKRKLGAKPIKIIINIIFFNKWNWNFVITSPKYFLITF